MLEQFYNYLFDSLWKTANNAYGLCSQCYKNLLFTKIKLQYSEMKCAYIVTSPWTLNGN